MAIEFLDYVHVHAQMHILFEIHTNMNVKDKFMYIFVELRV